MSESFSFLVNWKSRVLLPNKNIRNAHITGVQPGGFNLKFDQALPVGEEIALEFYVKYRDTPNRIRVKAKVTQCQLTSPAGANIKLKLSQISREDNHTLNNVLQTMAEMTESDSFNLRA